MTDAAGAEGAGPDKPDKPVKRRKGAAAVVAIIDAAPVMQAPETAAAGGSEGGGDADARRGEDSDDRLDDGMDWDNARPDSGSDDGMDFAVVEACAALDPSDTDNGQRLIRHFGDDLKVVARQAVSGGDWLAWTSTHWDMQNGVARAVMTAQRMGPRIKAEAAYIPATERETRLIEAGLPFRRKRRDALTEIEKGIADRAATAKASWSRRRNDRAKFGVSCKNESRLKNMLTAAAPHLRVPAKALNAEPLKFATLSHTLSFSRIEDPENPDPGGARWIGHCDASPGHDRKDLITALFPVSYDPEAICPRWEAFLAAQLPDEQKRATVQEFCGIGLTGLPLQLILFHYGAGANGKSVFMEVVCRLAGESFAVSLPAESITGAGSRNAGGASPDLIRLMGKRVLRVSELPAGKPVDIELIKRLTGGENMAVRDMYLGYVEFQNQAKAHWSGNDKPQLDGSDYAIFRRLLLVHWNVIIPEPDRMDFNTVVNRFLEEGPGILNWMIQGLLRYLGRGSLAVAEAIKDDTEEYRLEMDPFGSFVEACIASETGGSVAFRDIYEGYERWCVAAGRNDPKSRKKVGTLLKKKFRVVTVNGLPVYQDIRLVNLPNRSPDEGSSGRGGSYREVKS